MSFVPESLEVRLTPESPYVGETVVYRLELHRPENVSISVPADLDVSPFALNGISRHQEELEGGLVKEVVELELGVYAVDEEEVPALELIAVTPEGEAELSIPPQPVDVRSLIAEEGETPREMAPPETVWLPDYSIFKAAGVALAVFLLLVLLWKLISRLRSRPRKAPPAPPPLPPRPAFEVALEQLEALRAENLVGKGRRRPFFFRLSEIIREYLGARFEFDSLELTTTELMAKLRDRPTPGLDLDAMRAWCGTCDMVKFARHEPTDSECSEALTAAFGFVEDTRPAEKDESSLENGRTAASSGGGS